MAPFKSYTSEADLFSKLSVVSQVEWEKAKRIMQETEVYQLEENFANHRKLMKAYIDLRIKYNDLSILALQGKENVEAELEALTKKINETVAKMEKKDK